MVSHMLKITLRAVTRTSGGVMPNCAQTGMPARTTAVTASGKSAAPSIFAKSAPASFGQADGRADRAAGPLLDRPERQVDADQRAAHRAADGPGDDDHLVHRDLKGVLLAPGVHAHRVADRDDLRP